MLYSSPIRVQAARGLVGGRPFGVVGVHEFGAAGDGTTDDTAALQDALNAASGGGLVQGRPGAVYGITGTLKVPSGVTLQDVRLKRLRGVFDIITNADPTGDTDITLRRVVIDGQRSNGSLTRSNAAHRFSGVRFRNVTNSLLEDVKVIKTVNAEAQTEGNRAAIILEECAHCDVVRPYGNDNDGTFLWFASSTYCRAFGGRSVDDNGSGFSSSAADDCEVHDWLSLRSGGGGQIAFSGISLNGKRMFGSQLRAIGCTGAGVNIGHMGQDATGTRVTGIYASANQLEGLNIVGSTDVVCSDVFLEGNGLTAGRNNIRISGSDRVRLVQATSKAATRTGVYIDSGEHLLESLDVFNSGAIGINLEGEAVVTLRGVRSWNNGVTIQDNIAGIVVKGSGCRFVDVLCYGSQETGIWLNGGGGHTFINCDFTGNATYQVRETNSPTESTWVNSLPTT